MLNYEQYIPLAMDPCCRALAPRPYPIITILFYVNDNVMEIYYTRVNMMTFCALSSKTKILNRRIKIFCFVVVLQFRFCTIFNTNFCNSN